jgi:hypothetical protein
VIGVAIGLLLHIVINTDAPRLAARQAQWQLINGRRKIMADPDVDKFNKALEKLCLECGADVGKLLAGCKSSINSRLEKMAKDMTSVPVPSSGEPPKVQEQVNGFLKRAGSRYASILTLTAAVRIEGGKKVSLPASGISGPLATV